MSDTAILTSEQTAVEGELHYIIGDGPSIRYIDWPEEAHKEQLPQYEPHKVRIENGRKAAEPFELQKHGFVFRQHRTAVKNFFDEQDVLNTYYPEIENLIRKESGASRVVVFDHTVRTTDSSHHAERWIRSTVKSVHNDYTERSAPQRVRDILPPAEADAALQRRFAIIQVWRGIQPVVESEPLAMCDGRSIPASGFIRNERRYRDRTGETYHIAHNPAHKWYYFPLMKIDEALVFKVYDSDASAGVQFTAHTSFTDPTSPPDAAPRESIEMRAFAFY
ncbi:MAG: CmcJ/NvfI family oxidoreductase [Alphaproteobacteria bacterium]